MDGLTVSFPYHGLSQVKQESFDWLVPGMIREKVLNVFKLLPKPVRTQLTPLPKTEFIPIPLSLILINKKPSKSKD